MLSSVKFWAWLGLVVLFCAPVSAFESMYEIQGVGPEGSYQGSAVIEAKGGGWEISLKTFDARGAERRVEGRASRSGRGLRFTSRAEIDERREASLRVALRPVDGEGGGWVATYLDMKRQVVRRECWLPTEVRQIPLQVVVLSGNEAFAGVGPAQARIAQKAIVWQLDTVFERLDTAFHALTSEPLRIAGAPFDLDRDGKLSTAESRALRDALELRGVKRRGRVVIVVTATEFAHGDCRGWTLGDAPASPQTLDDPNDNFSLVGVGYLDPRRFHTVAHEVGHQLGLDDLNPHNRPLLDEPSRDDHLMISGGSGLHLDRAAAQLLSAASRQFPDHGLEGRLGAPRLGFVPTSARGDSADGLPVPGTPAVKR